MTNKIFFGIYLLLGAAAVSAVEIGNDRASTGVDLLPATVTTTGDIVAGGQLVVKGTATVEGSAFSVGGNTVISAGALGSAIKVDGSNIVSGDIGSGVEINAAQVTPGSYPAGTFVYQGPLTLTGAASYATFPSSVTAPWARIDAGLVGTSILAAGESFRVSGGSVTIPYLSNLGGAYLAGNVGIGTTAPATLLDVNGQATIRGQETVTGSMTITSGSGLRLTNAGAEAYHADILYNSWDVYGGVPLTISMAGTPKWRFAETGDLILGQNTVYTSTWTAATGGLALAGPLRLANKSIAELQAYDPVEKGETFFCTDSVPPRIMTSTGTAAGNFADAMGGEFK